MNKRISIGIMFMLVLASFYITTVTANPNIWLEVDGSFEGQAYVEMTWTLTVHEGTPPYDYCGGWGDDPPGMHSMWCDWDTYENPKVVSHTYREEGEYSIFFSVKDADGDKDVVHETVTIGPPPFIVEIIPPDVPEFWVNEPYQWDCNVIGGLGEITYYWDFGDGSDIDNDKAPVHAFEKPTLDDATIVELDVYDDIEFPPKHAEDEYRISPLTDPGGVWGYDLFPEINRILGHWAFPYQPIFFEVETWWDVFGSNIQSDDWYFDWAIYRADERLWDSGTVQGDVILGPNRQHRQRIVLTSAPTGSFGDCCPFEVTVYSVPNHDWNSGNNTAVYNIYLIAPP